LAQRSVEVEPGWGVSWRSLQHVFAQRSSFRQVVVIVIVISFVLVGVSVSIIGAIAIVVVGHHGHASSLSFGAGGVVLAALCVPTRRSLDKQSRQVSLGFHKIFLK
jgi:hypothetical protein